MQSYHPPDTMPASATLSRGTRLRTPLPFTDRRQLRVHGFNAAGACVVVLSLAVLLVWIVFSELAAALLERHQRSLAVPVLLGALWILRRQPRRGLHILADLHAGEVETHFVQSQLLPRPGIGVFLPNRWDLQVDEGRLDASDWAPSQLHAGRSVTLRSAPRSGILLGVEPFESETSPLTMGRHTPGADFSALDREILQLIAEGRSEREIGRQLDLAPRHLQVRVEALLRQLGADNRHDAIRQARELGLLRPV